MTSSTTGNYKDNALDPTNGVFSFYNAGSGNQQTNGMVRTTKPYSESVPEASPLNRPVEQGAPGTTWQVGTGNTVTTSYGMNGQDAFSRSVLTNNPGSNRVAKYDVTINSKGSRTLSRASNNAANYGTGQLYRTITWNENRTSSGGCLGSTEEYKDKEGRVVLKRTYNRYAAPGISTVLQQMSTYYVYDDLGNLSFVLPPAAKPDTMRRSARQHWMRCATNTAMTN
ncbi:MAG: hypothetical protein JKY70_11945 [Mucilaginibacter sp.]|nr:hypothetical protein [Mucilaginibacter sp.]